MTHITPVHPLIINSGHHAVQNAVASAHAGSFILPIIIVTFLSVAVLVWFVVIDPRLERKRSYQEADSSGRFILRSNHLRAHANLPRYMR